MNQLYISAMEATKAARYLSILLRRPVMRYMALNKYGAPLWVVSLDKTSHNAL